MANMKGNFGSIRIILGPMFSGKTSELFRLINRYCIAGLQVATIKYKDDDRYSSSDNLLFTHDNRKMEAIGTNNLIDVWDDVKYADVIGIDEGQFYTDLVTCARTWADEGKIVIVSALNGDFCQRPFENISSLIPHAEYITNLTAVCSCGNPASFTIRKTEQVELKVIGGSDIYSVFCRNCLNDQY